MSLKALLVTSATFAALTASTAGACELPASTAAEREELQWLMNVHTVLVEGRQVCESAARKQNLAGERRTDFVRICARRKIDLYRRLRPEPHPKLRERVHARARCGS